MPAYTTVFPRASRAGRARRLVLAAAGALLLGACSTDSFLQVTDPDIINPQDARSAAGANAVRLGALARLNAATSGTEGILLLGGLFADEYGNGDTFIARQEVDQHVITPANSFLTSANRALHRARLAAEQATGLLAEYAPSAPAWQTAEMYFVQAYVVNIMAEHYCNGLVFSTVDAGGAPVYGDQITTTQAFEQALDLVDAGLALVTGNSADDQRVRNALQVTKGRILNNLGRRAEAATAVAGVPTGFRYQMLHSPTTTTNSMWELNVLARRYSVSNGEGTNGLNFATAGDPRVPVCAGGDAVCKTINVTDKTKNDGSQPVYVQMLWPLRESPVDIVSGVEARLIEAEAALAADPGAAVGILNDLRSTEVTPAMAALADAGSPQANVDQLFRERAFWLFGRGHRTGDLRRLVRQYGRDASTVFPTGEWRPGQAYGPDVNLPVPQAEENNTKVTPGATCLDRNA